MDKATRTDGRVLVIKAGLLDGLRQLWFPVEFRIAAPGQVADASLAEADRLLGQAEAEPSALDGTAVSDEIVVEVGNCLWYLKTKFFKQAWEDFTAAGDDPRQRRAVGRLNKCIALFRESGVEVHDPTNERYPEGGEGTMRPIQFAPTDGLAFAQVTETVSPVIYRNDRLIQRGEVYVAVPKEPAAPSRAQAAQLPSEAGASPPPVEAVAGGPATDQAARFPEAANPAQPPGASGGDR